MDPIYILKHLVPGYGDLFWETEDFVCIIINEVILKNNYRKFVLKDGMVDICRSYHRSGESICRIISGCPRLSN